MTDKPSAMERAAEALNAAVQESGRTDFGGPIPVPNYRKAARAAILAYLSAIAEDEASVEAVARALCEAAGHDPDGPTMDIYVPNDPVAHMPWAGYRPETRAVLATLIERAKEQKP